MFDFELEFGDRGEPVRMIQKAINESGALTKHMVTDGDFGPILKSSLKLFQQFKGIPVTGVYGTKENDILGPLIDRKYVMINEIDTIAKQFDLPISMLKAIREVEGKSDGFQPDGRPIILFERHKFYLYYSKIASAAKVIEVSGKNPDICNIQEGGYVGGTGEYNRLHKAYGFDAVSANMSTSFGMFQQMGFNYAISDYPNVTAFVEAMKNSEKDQLVSIVKFITKNAKLAKAVRNKEYANTALYYNGAGYKKNNYDVKLMQADKKYS
jgi:peptidoglycan hydrolase-like protein with peptidoglycan-binding domain